MSAMLPTLRQLQYLKLLAEHASFSRAAEAAHVSQPALSAGVQELEKILGAPVVELHTGEYAHAAGEQVAVELRRLADMAALAAKNGIEPHAGHGLTFENVQAGERTSRARFRRNRLLSPVLMDVFT